MPIGSPQWMYKSGEAFTLDQSLGFDGGDGAHFDYLSRTPSSVGNRRTWTFSCWIKRGTLGTVQILFSGGGRFGTAVGFDTSDRIDFGVAYAEVTRSIVSTARYRDPNAWYHIVAVQDTTESTGSDRLKLYVNGSRLTAFDTDTASALPEDEDFTINTAVEHFVSGGWRYPDTNRFDGYMAEVHFIDGTALTPTSFGESGDYGEWKPKEVSGLTYGTNGFYLPFKNDYEVEGFSAVTYRGNAVNGHYIGGTGFSPDLTWIKERSSTSNHQLHDTIRGAGTALYLPDTSADDYSATTVQAFNSDGFTVGSHGAVNASGDTYVAWNWDMGGASGPKTFTLTSNGDPEHSTTQKKFGTSSIHLDGSDGLYIADGTSDDYFDFGTAGDFTLECWAYRSTSGTSQALIDIRGPTHNDYCELWLHSSGLYVSGTNISFTTSYTPAVDTWFHVALVRSGGTAKMYVDGDEKGEDTSTGQIGGTDWGVAIGQYRTAGGSAQGEYWNGYIDQVRFSNSARYAANFIPSNQAFGTDGNTLLLVQSNTTNGSTTFVDSGGDSRNTDGTITSNVAANPTYGQSIISWTGTGATGTVGTGLTSDAEFVIVKNRSTTDNWSSSTTVIDGSVDGLYLNAAGAFEDWSARVDPSSATSNTIGVYDWDDGNKSGSSMIAYAFHSVTGYSKIGSYTGDGGSSNTITTGFKPAFVMIKNTSTGARPWVIFDGVRSGGLVWNDYLKANENVAETVDNTNRKITVSDTGFTLGIDQWVNQNESVFVYIAFADKREYAYWLDQSGNNNDWTSNNLTESDIMVDSPTNNFATLNPLWIPSTYASNATGTLSQGNLHMEIEQAGGYWRNLPATMASTNLDTYFEVLWTEKEGANALFSVWAGNDLTNSAEGTGTFVKYEQDGDVIGYQGRGTLATVTAPVQGDIIGCAIDDTNVKFYLNNTLLTTQTHGVSGEDIFGGVMVYNNGHDCQATINFGQDSSFAGNKTAQGNQDGNDIGDFYYTPPTGYFALCTSNLPAVAVTPSEHFETVLYTGDGASTQAVTTNFEPDLIWNKMRGEDLNHRMYDRVRGFANQINSNQAYEENKYTDYGHPTATSSTSVTIGQGTDSGNLINASSDAGVLWNWKAGGSGSANTDGNMAETVTVSANVDAGFSIVTYTGDGAAGTVGHGLSKAPDLIIVKNRDVADGWRIYHSRNTAAPETDWFVLNTAGGTTDDTPLAWNDTAPTADVFTVGTNHSVNADDETYVAYCFHDVDGFSKFGAYTGNANADGTFVYCGFRPQLVIIKLTSGSDSWMMYDTEREPHNLADTAIFADTSSAESTSASKAIDILSNGFKARGADGAVNNGTYVYMAWAETPFKYSNAR